MITQLIRAASMADAATLPQRQVSVQVSGAGVEVVGRVTTPLAGARASLMIDWETALRYPDSIVTAVEMMTARVIRETAPTAAIVVEHEAPASPMDRLLRGSLLIVSVLAVVLTLLGWRLA
ncbi:MULTISPECIES: hypothetical protein [unclassified Novosphingobium]|uniref:hypothetical protein n=1 Tax=unclassified Novosphingobium TaxID=2644732 RepID=UPI000D322D75|nr:MULTISPECIES: hypothetical protein [unclassified Novosphingobium]PTR11789.1 hypothetical protein C8K11_104148 [Novosphingobium sp. GV055]PUB04829.1 hypothetical protein C8K12_104148 [Novosphingobium sp. GV061]PUB21148.1 hypothetical protein C8K14_104148 [Novosphingobium sp. GV079]PUB42874.1 hypothetical protein C8K10_104148 [Novosphingobium sp. GV027]